jgi:hypothetical protein
MAKRPFPVAWGLVGLLALVLWLLILPFLMPICLTVGGRVFLINASHPPGQQLLRLDDWGIRQATIGNAGTRVGVDPDRIFEFQGQLRTRSIVAAGWAYHLVWFKGKQVK